MIKKSRVFNRTSYHLFLGALIFGALFLSPNRASAIHSGLVIYEQTAVGISFSISSAHFQVVNNNLDSYIHSFIFKASGTFNVVCQTSEDRSGAVEVITAEGNIFQAPFSGVPVGTISSVEAKFTDAVKFIEIKNIKWTGQCYGIQAGDNPGPVLITTGDSNIRGSYLQVWGGETPPGVGSARHPVLIIPGITGTELLNSSDELIWPNISRMFGDINDQFLTDNLSLDETGNSKNSIISGEVIKTIFVKIRDDPVPIIDIFSGLIDGLKVDEYVIGESLFFFPYDWRLDLNITRNELDKKIEQIKSSTGFSKINIIAHSMGGLLTEEYIFENGADSIDKLIFVGTPHLGAPKSAKVLLHGDHYSIPWLEEDRIKEIARNSPAVYQLLPSPNYFENFTGYISPFRFFSGPSMLNYDDTKQFLINRGANEVLLDRAEEFFAQNLYAQDFGDIEVHNIAGCKTPTQAAYSYTLGNSIIGRIGYTSGDGTVPFVSADNINADVKYYVKNGSHASLPSNESTRELILNILNNNPVLPENISHNTAFCNFKGRQLTWKSPVEIHIYDQNGNHAGPIPGGFENNLPGVDYEIIDGEKFIFIPTDDGNTYTIAALGEEEGTFDLTISEIDNGDIVSATVYNDIPITDLSEVTVDTNDQVNYDYEGDGNFEVLTPSSVLTGDAINDLTPPETQISLIDTPLLNNWFKGPVEATLTATDDLSGVLETKYSLDGGTTFMNYSGLFQIANLGITEIQYYSVDKAGNNETIQKSQVKIDNAPPEFEIWFDMGSKKLLFNPIDDADPNPSIVCTNRQCTASDQAGNSSDLNFSYVSNRSAHNVILREVSYNQQGFQKLGGIVNVQLKTRGEEIRKFNQLLTSKGVNAIIRYNNRKDESSILIQRPKQHAERETADGTKLLHLMTNSGKINMEIK
ncbi:MAG: hypothetical protein Q8P83_02775 [bacterium]|nr:hypothetical protein [bacterium]